MKLKKKKYFFSYCPLKILKLTLQFFKCNISKSIAADLKQRMMSRSSFSQLLQFFVHIHPDPPLDRATPTFFILTITSIYTVRPPPPSPPSNFFIHFHNNFNSVFTSTRTTPPGPPSDFFLHFHNDFNSLSTSTLTTPPHLRTPSDFFFICIFTITSILRDINPSFKFQFFGHIH